MGAAAGGTAGDMDPGEDAVRKILFPHSFNTMGQKPLGTAQSLLADGDADTTGTGLKKIFSSPPVASRILGTSFAVR